MMPVHDHTKPVCDACRRTNRIRYPRPNVLGLSAANTDRTQLDALAQGYLLGDVSAGTS